MKFSPLIALSLIIGALVSCKKDSVKTIKDYNIFINQYDTSNLNKLISSRFIIKNNPYLTNEKIAIDSLKKIGSIIRLKNVTSYDSIVKTEEIWTSKFDSLLGIKSSLKVYNTYFVSEGIIEKIHVDSIENIKDYNKEYNLKNTMFLQYLRYEYNSLSNAEKEVKLFEILKKYSQLTDKQRKEYYVKAYLNNATFVSIGNSMGIETELHFVGNSTVNVSLFGLSLSSLYSIDNGLVRIEPAGGLPMILRIRDQNTMVYKSFQGTQIFKRIRTQ